VIGLKASQMCIISRKEETLKQPQNKGGCQNQQSHLNNFSMVTPSKSNLSSKTGQGGGGSNKKSQHTTQHHTKRHQTSQSTSTNNTSASLQKSRQNQHRSSQTKYGNKPHIPHNRSSPNLNTSNFNNINNQRNQQRQNRQTPPRNIIGNYVNMNNGQPSLERTKSNPVHTQKNPVAQSKQQPQILLQNCSQQAQKGNITNGSPSSPICSNISKSNRSSPQCFEGSKCFQPPTPNCLPKPPSDWTPFLISNSQNIFSKASHSLAFDAMVEANAGGALDNHISVSSARDVSQELKLILNVHA
jgi:hypothetical protein